MSLISGIFRRRSWFQQRPSSGAAAGLLRNMTAFMLRSNKAARLPSLVKIDISPQCALACPHCLHAEPAGRDRPLLDAQRFHKQDRMDLEQYAHIIDQIKGKALAVSLFYYGDPLVHPDLDAMIALAARARLETHITSHFSYRFDEARIKRLVDAGLSHITVAVDGATQESYATTRIRGRLDWVLANLTMLADYKRKHGLKKPFIEVQHITFPHHAPDEFARVKKIANEIGADTFTSFEGLRFDDKGDLYNVVDDDPGAHEEGGVDPEMLRRPSVAPYCHWPYSSTVIRYDGDVIPCCLWRPGRQYVPDNERDPHILGNVFSQDLESIWNSASYQALRRQVSNPHRTAADPEKTPSFCDGCPRLNKRPN